MKDDRVYPESQGNFYHSKDDREEEEPEEEGELENLTCHWPKKDCQDRDSDGLCTISEDACYYDDMLSDVVGQAEKEGK